MSRARHDLHRHPNMLQKLLLVLRVHRAVILRASRRLGLRVYLNRRIGNPIRLVAGGFPALRKNRWTVAVGADVVFADGGELALGLLNPATKPIKINGIRHKTLVIASLRANASSNKLQIEAPLIIGHVSGGSLRVCRGQKSVRKKA